MRIYVNLDQIDLSLGFICLELKVNRNIGKSHYLIFYNWHILTLMWSIFYTLIIHLNCKQIVEYYCQILNEKMNLCLGATDVLNCALIMIKWTP